MILNKYVQLAREITCEQLNRNVFEEEGGNKPTTTGVVVGITI